MVDKGGLQVKIQRIETYPLFYRLKEPYGDANGYKKYRTCFLIRLVTETGVEGWGECVDWLPSLVKGFEERIQPYLLGKLATDRIQLVTTIRKWHKRLAAAVSMALTEIVAKFAKLHVTDLWGGRLRNKVPVYASFQSYRDQVNWIEVSLNGVEQALDQGFNLVKLKVGGKTIQEDQQHIETILRTMQPHQQIALDANQSYDLASAREWKGLLNKWPHFSWLEEPIAVDYTADYSLLRGILPIALAGGEDYQSPVSFIPHLQSRSLDMLTPDLLHIGGVEEYRDTLRIARYYGLRVSPHSYDGALVRLYSAFIQSTLPPWSKAEEEQIEAVEWDVMDNPFTSLLAIQPTGGEVQIPTGIGLGVEWDWEKINFYRWDGLPYI